MINWDEILDDFARKCKGGAPDMTNPRHLALLRESLLKFGWKENITNEFIGELREDKPGVFFGYTKKNKKRYFPDAGKLAAAIKRKSVTAAPNSGGGAAAGVGVKPKKKKKKVAKHTASKGGGKPAPPKPINQKIDFTKNPPESITKEINPDSDSFQQKIDDGDIEEDSYKQDQIEVPADSGQYYSQPLTLEDIESFFPNPPHKIPKKYITALQRILNTQKASSNNPNISEFVNPSGAGQISAQAAELLTLMTTSMGDKEADQFFAVLNKTSGNRNGREIIDPKWMAAAQASRRTILRQVKQKYGKKATIEFAGWDVKEDVEDGIGLDYGKKGFSTDVYFRVKTPKGSVSHEVSLKKDLATFFANPGSKGIEDDFPPGGKPKKKTDQAGLITENSKDRSNKRLKKIKQSDIDTLTNKTDAELITTLENLPPGFRSLCLEGSPPKKPYTLSKEAKTYIQFYKNLKAKGYTFPLSKQDLNDPKVAEIAKASGIKGDSWGKSKVNTKGTNKLAVFTAYMQYAEELSQNPPVTKGPASQFLNNQVGIDDPPPAGSSRAVANLHIKKLGDPVNRAVLLKLIKDKFPLKSMLAGEETMALSNNSLDRETCIAIFGTADYNKISQKITIKKDKITGDYYMSYTAKVGSVPIRIGVVTCRQRGLGYASLTTEIAPTDEFRHRTYCANKANVNPNDWTEEEKSLNDRLTADPPRIKMKSGRWKGGFGPCEKPNYKTKAEK